MPTEQLNNPLFQLTPYILIFLIFYFLVIKPQKDKQKEQKNQIDNVKKNDQVITSGGMHGRIILVKDKTVIVRVDDNVKIEFDKESINTVVKSKSDDS